MSNRKRITSWTSFKLFSSKPKVYNISMAYTKFSLTWSLPFLVLIVVFVGRVPNSAGKSISTFSAIDNGYDKSVVLNDGDDGDGDNYLAPAGKRLPDGYYYVDDGQLKAVSASNVRRQDGKKVRFTPLVKYKHTGSKRRKFFVPNLFG